MSTPTYPSDGFMFRPLSPEDEADFAQWAWNNNPPTNDTWSTYHPACRKVWTERGLVPEDVNTKDPRCAACQVPEHEMCPLISGCPCCQDTFEQGMVLP